MSVVANTRSSLFFEDGKSPSHLVYVHGRERLNGVYGGTLGRPSNSDKFLKRGRLEGDASRVDGTVMGGDLGK